MTFLRRFLLVAALLLVTMALFAAAPLIGAVWFSLWFLWETFRDDPGRRSRQQQEVDRVEHLIDLHLLAHKLPNTPANRWRVLDGLCQPQPKRKRKPQ